MQFSKWTVENADNNEKIYNDLKNRRGTLQKFNNTTFDRYGKVHKQMVYRLVVDKNNYIALNGQLYNKLNMNRNK